MEIENDLIKLYYNFIKNNSIFSEEVLIVPKTPKSFTKFPTIVIKENNNVDFIGGKTLNRQEFMNLLTYTVDIYSKDIIVGQNKYLSANVLKELKLLTFQFFNDIGFNRISSNKAEFIDITVDRNISTFQGKVNNWNGYII